MPRDLLVIAPAMEVRDEVERVRRRVLDRWRWLNVVGHLSIVGVGRAVLLRQYRCGVPPMTAGILSSGEAISFLGVEMPESLRLNIEALHHASNGMFDHMDSSRTEHSLHDDELTEAAGSWKGPIGDALSHVATTWAEQRTALHTQVGHIGMAMGDAAQSYQSTDEDAATPIAKAIDL